MSTSRSSNQQSPLLCRLWGHAWDPEGAEHYCVYWCTRCDHHGYTDGSVRERISLWFWIRRVRIRDFFRSAWRWFRCEYCGYYFGRHDDSADHIPF